jgi:hypothetical protein
VAYGCRRAMAPRGAQQPRANCSKHTGLIPNTLIRLVIFSDFLRSLGVYISSRETTDRLYYKSPHAGVDMPQVVCIGR